jgi:hypothetical protein
MKDKVQEIRKEVEKLMYGSALNLFYKEKTQNKEQ